MIWSIAIVAGILVGLVLGMIITIRRHNASVERQRCALAEQLRVTMDWYAETLEGAENGRHTYTGPYS